MGWGRMVRQRLLSKADVMGWGGDICGLRSFSVVQAIVKGMSWVLWVEAEGSGRMG